VTLQAACSRLASFAEFQATDCGCGCGLSQAVAEAVLDDASDLVYALSRGQIFGVCEGTVRPCRTCWCGSCVCCCEIEAIPLRRDAIEVSEVVIDGVVLAAENYTLTPRGKLVKVSTDGDRPDPWPCCQKLYRGLDEADTFGVTYTFGQAEQPQWVKNAVIELACDMASYFDSGSSHAKLPGNTTAVTYANVTLSMDDRADALRDGSVLAAFPAVAILLSLVGPTQGGMAYSPSGGSAWSFPLS